MSSASVPDRLVRSATHLLRSRGADGFGMTELLEHSNVARRSMYQHFPEGKAQLLHAATLEAGRLLETGMAALLAETTAVDALQMWVDYWKKVLVESDYRLGCPLAAASLSSQDYPDAAAAAATAFDRFAELLAESFIRDGLPEDDARTAGTVIVSGVEGAIITARARRTVEPFDTLAAHVRAVWGTPD